MEKKLPAMQETWVTSLGQEDPLEKEMGTHSSILAWEIPWMEEPGGLRSLGSQRVKHNWVTNNPKIKDGVLICYGFHHKLNGLSIKNLSFLTPFHWIVSLINMHFFFIYIHNLWVNLTGQRNA